MAAVNFMKSIVQRKPLYNSIPCIRLHLSGSSGACLGGFEQFGLVSFCQDTSKVDFTQRKDIGLTNSFLDILHKKQGIPNWEKKGGGL